jgi:hypothetical protein
LESVVEPVAQLVEQLPFKPWVVGSSPTRFTFICSRIFECIICNNASKTAIAVNALLSFTEQIDSLLTNPVRLKPDGVFLCV